MARKPKLRLHATGRYVVRIDGKDRYLGTNKAAAEREYYRLLAYGLPESNPDTTVTKKLIVMYCNYCEQYGSGINDRLKAALRYLNTVLGDYTADQISMAELRRLREEMIKPKKSGKRHCRTEINRMMNDVTRFWKWVAAEELAIADVHGKCMVLEPLKRGRCDAPESKPVSVVKLEHIRAVQACSNASVAAMIELQLLTGARPGEIVGLKAEDFDKGESVWQVELTEHKTAHRGKKRVLFFGEQAQKVLKPFFLKRAPGEHLFSPQDFFEKKREEAVCPRRPDQISEPPKTERKVGTCYTTDSYRKAVAYGCKQAKVPHWHPHQLRHTAATELRKQYGVEVARAVLGHSHIAATEIYAEVDQQVAQRIAKERG